MQDKDGLNTKKNYQLYLNYKQQVKIFNLYLIERRNFSGKKALEIELIFAALSFQRSNQDPFQITYVKRTSPFSFSRMF